jgi:hypothetical protein
MKRLAAGHRFMATAQAGGMRSNRQAGRGSSSLALSGSATPAMASASRIRPGPTLNLLLARLDR